MDTKTLIEKACEASRLEPAQGRRIIEAFSRLLSESGSELDSVAVPGFGVFESRKRRVNVHPATGRRMLLPPKIVIGFKPSAILKQKLK